MTLGLVSPTVTRIGVPAGSLTEAALMRAYEHGRPRTCECVCGGWPISVLDEGNGSEVARAIDVHSRSTSHQLWRRIEGIA